MKTLRPTLLAAFVAILFFYGCSKGPSEPEQPKTHPTEITTIYGEVVDESGAKMPGVTVTTGTSTATTDSRGIFILKDATVRKGRASVLAKKSGYFTSARATETGKNGTTQVKLHMMANTANYNVSANAGGTVNVAGGASVVFEAGSFLKSDGSAYMGNVKVAARYLNPDNTNFYDNFSGDNLAQTTSGDEVSLISCGVLRVEIQGASGETLKLATGKEATLNYPVPTSQSTAPTSMPLWYFDEALGMWKEEGSATLSGGKYTGKVSHFTDWNLDYKGETGEVEMRIVCNGIPIQGVAVKIGGFTHKTGYSDAEGKLGFVRTPADKEIEIYINSSDNDGLYYINAPVKVTLTPGQRTNIGDIVLNSPCPAAIEGTLIGCDDKPTEGLIAVSFGTDIKYIYTKDGKFTLAAPSATTLAVNAMDVNGNVSVQTDVIPLAEGELKNIGDVKVCGPNTISYRDIATTMKDGGSMALSPDGTLIAVMEYGGALTIYETSTGNTLMSATVSGLNRGYGSLQFSDDNKKLMVCSPYDETIILDLGGASPVQLSSIPNLYQAQMYSDGSKLIGTTKISGVNTVALFSTADGSLINTIAVPNMSDSIGRFGLREAENALMYFDKLTQGLLHGFDIAGTADLWSVTLAGNAWSTFFSANGEVIAVTSDYKNYSCHDTKTGVKLADVNSGSQNSGISGGGMALTSNFAYSVGFLDDAHTTSLINITSYAGAPTLPKILSGAKYVSSISVSKGDEYLAAMYYGGIRIWKLK